MPTSTTPRMTGAAALLTGSSSNIPLPPGMNFNEFMGYMSAFVDHMRKTETSNMPSLSEDPQCGASAAMSVSSASEPEQPEQQPAGIYLYEDILKNSTNKDASSESAASAAAEIKVMATYIEADAASVAAGAPLESSVTANMSPGSTQENSKDILEAPSHKVASVASSASPASPANAVAAIRILETYSLADAASVAAGGASSENAAGAPQQPQSALIANMSPGSTQESSKDIVETQSQKVASVASAASPASPASPASAARAASAIVSGSAAGAPANVESSVMDIAADIDIPYVYMDVVSEDDSTDSDIICPRKKRLIVMSDSSGSGSDTVLGRTGQQTLEHPKILALTGSLSHFDILHKILCENFTDFDKTVFYDMSSMISHEPVLDGFYVTDTGGKNPDSLAKARFRYVDFFGNMLQKFNSGTYAFPSDENGEPVEITGDVRQDKPGVDTILNQHPDRTPFLLRFNEARLKNEAKHKEIDADSRENMLLRTCYTLVQAPEKYKHCIGRMGLQYLGQYNPRLPREGVTKATRRLPDDIQKQMIQDIKTGLYTSRDLYNKYSKKQNGPVHLWQVKNLVTRIRKSQQELSGETGLSLKLDVGKTIEVG